MADVDGATLAVAIQAVHESIGKLEALLTSETLRDRAEIQDLIFSYERAGARLKSAYLAELASGVSNLPAYEDLVGR